jgi:SPP1 gp7 family putative phage head morphogenesis protein
MKYSKITYRIPNDAAYKISKAKRINRDRASVKKPMMQWRKILKAFLKEQSVKMAKEIGEKLNKAVVSSEVQEVLDALNFSNWAVLITDNETALEAIARSGVAAALTQIGISDQDITNLANQKAIEYAKSRSAELVGKKWVDGELVDNPKAHMTITESTREFLRGTVTQAMEEGWSNDRLSDELQDNYAFSESRADTIARTETAYADVQGNMDAYRESGMVEQKQWIVGDECCDDCEMLDGEIVGIDEDFPDGAGDSPPLHPNCRCDVIPVLSEDDTSNTDNTENEQLNNED